MDGYTTFPICLMNASLSIWKTFFSVHSSCTNTYFNQLPGLILVHIPFQSECFHGHGPMHFIAPLLVWLGLRIVQCRTHLSLVLLDAFLPSSLSLKCFLYRIKPWRTKPSRAWHLCPQHRSSPPQLSTTSWACQASLDPPSPERLG